MDYAVVDGKVYWGSFQLNDRELKATVDLVLPGTYILARQTETSVWELHIGRGDSNLLNALSGWVGHFDSFLFRYATTPSEAYGDECSAYHFLTADKRFALVNQIHPERPIGLSVDCPLPTCWTRTGEAVAPISRNTQKVLVPSARRQTRIVD